MDAHFEVTRWIFLRGLAFIYLMGFLNIVNQFRGLLGDRGILPARLFIAKTSFRDAIWNSCKSTARMDLDHGLLRLAAATMGLLLPLRRLPRPCPLQATRNISITDIIIIAILTTKITLSTTLTTTLRKTQDWHAASICSNSLTPDDEAPFALFA